MCLNDVMTPSLINIFSLTFKVETISTFLKMSMTVESFTLIGSFCKKSAFCCKFGNILTSFHISLSI